jgi:hypothetical protein
MQCEEKKIYIHKLILSTIHISYYYYSSSTFRIRPSGLLPIRINLELWIL